ncbi:MAG: 4-alpha-glucanotransferase, partial [Prevotella sp.]|nr:4-alpha-glucanotransferase [Prevotella sp.]
AFRSERVQKSGSQEATPRLRLVVRAPQLRKDQRLAIVGESEFLGAWNACKAVEMTEQNACEWAVELPLQALNGKNQEVFKFLAVADNENPLWETFDNRVIGIPTHLRTGDMAVYELNQAIFDLENQRFAGTLVPVFSLRSKGSFGVGDFGDLQMMIDWVAKTGQRVLQLLPVNDTTATHTKADSYPYSCISVFALHPQYCDLRQLPDIQDDTTKTKYETLRQELNALPQLDYERVNKAKNEYLHLIFAQIGNSTLRTKAFRAFFKENEHWLKPYARFCQRRDKNRSVKFHYFVQFILDAQLKSAHEHAREQGVILKGDIPIGVSRTGCDVLTEPQYFNLDGQAGAPPDDFAADGQNWGFPTYNWDAMLRDDCAWWVRRLQHMSRYFDAYRIDHVLGFFRIWEIPMPHKSGLEGQFSPALGLSMEEIKNHNIHRNIDKLFLPDHKDKKLFHPRILAQKTAAFQQLSKEEQADFNLLYDDYFYHRNNQFWYGEAMKKLPRLVEATRMLVCAEDLGMVPACVKWVMDELRILSLEIQSMPKETFVRFSNLQLLPYRSVCTISTHDMPTLRMWWDEDVERAQNYYNSMLDKDGFAPHPMPGWLARDIIAQHLAAPSMLCIIALQDWFAIDEQLRLKNADVERINVPSDPNHYWRYRMHVNIEDLMGCEGFSNAVGQLVALSGR